MFKKVNKLLSSFTDLGFTEVFDTRLNNSGKLDKIKLHIYNLTKNYLIDHDLNIDLDSKLKIPFKEEVDENFLNSFLRSINNDNELQKIIESEEVVDKFKLIFHKPIKYKISVFRALLPLKVPKLYPWHQDEGTWYLFKDKYFKNKLMGIMWLSINGSNILNSIELLQKSHNPPKLLRHNFQKGLGYFNAKIKDSLDLASVRQIKTNPGEALIFHNLTLHRTSNKMNDKKMIPRYSIDIRYYEEDKILNYDVDFFFKIEGFLRSLNIKFRKDNIKY
jgi:hypothetical protein